MQILQELFVAWMPVESAMAASKMLIENLNKYYFIFNYQFEDYQVLTVEIDTRIQNELSLLFN